MDRSFKDYIAANVQLAADNCKLPNSTHVGCVLVKNGVVIAVGMNGNAPGADDPRIAAMGRDDRNRFAIHAEENAILNAAMNGTSVCGAEAYVSHYPCPGCASKLKKVGITKIFYRKSGDPVFDERWVFPELADILKVPEDYFEEF